MEEIKRFTNETVDIDGCHYIVKDKQLNGLPTIRCIASDDAFILADFLNKQEEKYLDIFHRYWDLRKKLNRISNIILEFENDIESDEVVMTDKDSITLMEERRKNIKSYAKNLNSYQRIVNVCEKYNIPLEDLPGTLEEYIARDNIE